MSNDRSLTIENGNLVVETTEDVGGAKKETRLFIHIGRKDAPWIVAELVRHFQIEAAPPKLLPRKVFDALPPAMQQDVMARGFQLYDYPEHLEPDALEYDVKLKPRH